MLSVRRCQHTVIIRDRRIDRRCAPGAGDRAIVHIVQARGIEGMSSKLAVRALLGIGIEQGAVVLVGADRHGLPRCLGGHIQSLILRALDDLRVAVQSRAGRSLAGQVAADVIDNALGAVLRLLHVANHRIGSRIRVIVAAEHEVDARLFQIRRDRLYGRLGQNTLRAIDRHMRDQHLPAAIRLQLLCDLRGRVDETAVRRALALVVDHHDADITVFHRIPEVRFALRQVKDVAGNLAVAVAHIFVVAKRMDQRRAVQLFLIDHGKEALPVFKLGDIVDCVAGLDAEVIAARAQLLQRAFQIGSTARLNIAEDEEIRRLLRGVRRSKMEDFRPRRAVADLIIIGRSGTQAAQPCDIAAKRIARCAFHEELNFGRSGKFHRARHVCFFRIADERFFCRAVNAAQPGDALSGGCARHGVILHAKR